MRTRLLGLAVLCSAGALAVSSTPVSAAAKPTAKWFHSSSGNIQCEVVSGDSRGTYAYCQTAEPARSAQLKADGTFTVCKGEACIGDGPEDAFTLATGKSTTVGRFRCTAKTNGIECVVSASGRGFLIGRAALRKV